MDKVLQSMELETKKRRARIKQQIQQKIKRQK